MKTISRIFLLGGLFFSMASFATAGEVVEGNGVTKEAAARAAEARARDLAREKGTCEITRSKLSQCIRESDGTWTCYAAADNHGSSCK
jgi:hypothetical protein